MDYVTDTAAKVIVQLLPYAWRGIKKCIWLKEEIIYTRDILEVLERQLKDVDDKLKREDKKPLNAVKGWEEDVRTKRKDVDKLADEFRRNFLCGQQNMCVGGCRNFWHGEKINRQVDGDKFQMEQPNGCFGVFPYFWHRFKITRKVDDYKSKIKKLQKIYKEFEGNYVGGPFRHYRNPGRYTEVLFETEMLKIQDWLMDERVQVIGMWGKDSDCTTSLLKHVYNNGKVREHFNDMIFFVEASSSLTYDSDTVRKSICKEIDLPTESKDALFTRLSREELPFLLLLNDLQDGFSQKKLENMVTDIGLHSLKKKTYKIVFSCQSERVVATMNVKETSIEILPREPLSWMAFQEAEESIPHAEKWEFYKTNKSSRVFLSAVHISDMIYVHCFACILQFCFGYDTILLFSLFSWLFVLTLIYLLWWWRTRRWEPKVSPAESTQELEERSYSEELKTLSTWFSWGTIPRTGNNNCRTGLQTEKQELGSTSRFERKLDAEPVPEIVPIDD